MLTYSFHFSQFNIYQFSRKNPSLAQSIPGIYNKIIIKILGYFWGVTTLPHLIKFRPRNLPYLNSCGYCFRIISSLSYVASSVLWFLHNTLTIGIFLFRNSFTSRAKISAGSSSYVKSNLSSIVFEETTCDGSNQYLLNIEIWKTLWIFSNSGGNTKRYATGPIFLITS